MQSWGWEPHATVHDRSALLRSLLTYVIPTVKQVDWDILHFKLRSICTIEWGGASLTMTCLPPSLLSKNAVVSQSLVRTRQRVKFDGGKNHISQWRICRENRSSELHTSAQGFLTSFQPTLNYHRNDTVLRPWTNTFTSTEKNEVQLVLSESESTSVLLFGNVDWF